MYPAVDSAGLRLEVQCAGKPKVAFVCFHNSCRSQIAEALGRKLASDVFESYSAGTELKDHINPICMVVGVLMGHFIPALLSFLNRFEYARVFIPMAVLIYPMMLKVDFQGVRNVGNNPKGLFGTWVVNWLIKPFTMYGGNMALLCMEIYE